MGPGEYGLKRLIITADDYGTSLPVNEAVENAHKKGILTSTSLMVGGQFAKDAIIRTKQLPNLRVGLHIVLVRGASLLSPEIIPDLVDKDGYFDRNLVRAGFRYFFIPRVRKQLAAEIRAQFEAFQKTGLSLDHVNAHNHMQIHPTVLNLIIRIGKEFGLSAIRVPYEPRYGMFLLPWIKLMKRKVRKAKLQFNDFIFGIHDTGRMNIDCLVRLINSLPDGVSEIFMHPATGPSDGIEPEAINYQFEAEYKALIDPVVKDIVTRTGVKLISFCDLN